MADQRIEDLTIKPEKSKPVEVKIPEGILKVIADLKTKKGQLVNQYLNLSFQVDELTSKKNEKRNKVKDTSERIGQKIKYAFDKLKLKKRKNYRWGYNGGDSFVGNLVPEKPKEPKK